MTTSRFCRMAVALLACLTPGLARADSFYVVVFGFQRPVINDAPHSHTFATFVRTNTDGKIEQFTISWLPKTAEVRPLKLTAEPGRNFTLAETIAIARDKRTEVGTWGPYEIKQDLWDRAVEQKAWLDSGKVAYKAIDGGSPDGTVSNCVHAVSYMTRTPGQRNPQVYVLPAAWGESGSYWTALALRPWFVDPRKVHKDLLHAIGLNPDDIRFHGLDRNPSLNPAIRLVQDGFQSRLLPNRVPGDR